MQGESRIPLLKFMYLFLALPLVPIPYVCPVIARFCNTDNHVSGLFWVIACNLITELSIAVSYDLSYIAEVVGCFVEAL